MRKRTWASVTGLPLRGMRGGLLETRSVALKYGPAHAAPMAAPAFSTFSALTEALVTAAVFYAYVPALRGAAFRYRIAFAAIAYETLFNITYMVRSLFDIGPGERLELSGGELAFVAFHGSLSLAMFVALIAFTVLAYRAAKVGRNVPIEHRNWTLLFLGLWIVSVTTGWWLYFDLYVV